MADFNVFMENKEVLTPEECRTKFTLPINGSNFYVGINKINTSTFGPSGSTHGLAYYAYFQRVLAGIKDVPDDHLTIVIGLEPPSKPDEDDEGKGAYPYVDNHLDLVTAVANDFATFQQTAISLGKKLKIYIRYASEMNDKHWGFDDNGQRVEHLYEALPGDFKESYRTVRQIFARAAPEVLFSFSPALRADLLTDEPYSISDYWPGQDVVDVLAGTWYVGRQADFDKSRTHMHAYFHQFAKFKKPFGIDELGGRFCDSGQGDPKIDQMLKLMLEELDQHVSEGQFLYITAFLQNQWGASSEPEAFHPTLTLAAPLIAALSAPAAGPPG